MNAKTSTPHLYEIADEYRAAFRDLSEMDGMTPEIIADSLAGIKGEFEDKAEAVYMAMRNIEQQADEIDGLAKPFKDEAERLTDKAKSLRNRAEWLKDYLLVQMTGMKAKKIERPVVTITRVSGRDKVIVDDADLLPDDFVVIETTVKPDAKKLLSELKKDGCEIKGAHLEKTKDSMRFK